MKSSKSPTMPSFMFVFLLIVLELARMGVGAPAPRTVFFHVHAAFPGLGAAIAVILYFTIASPISQ